MLTAVQLHSQELKPYTIVSIADMWKFYPIITFLHSLRLHDLTRSLEIDVPKSEFSRAKTKHVKEWEKIVQELRKEHKHIHLPRTDERLQRIKLRDKTHRYLVGELRHELIEMGVAILGDLKGYTFLQVPSNRVNYFENDDLFEIAGQFPTANIEIKLAGNCYATENYTACVFHLMRAVEVGLKLLVVELKAEKYLNETIREHGKAKVVRKPVELCDWNKLITGLNSALESKKAGTKTSTAKKDLLEFYSQAIAQFDNFRNAWRNKVSHSNKIYPPGETKDIMDNTRQFLQKLATRIKE